MKSILMLGVAVVMTSIALMSTCSVRADETSEVAAAVRVSATDGSAADPRTEFGRPVSSGLAFTLKTVDGESVSVQPSSDSEFTVVCFLGTECPLAKLYTGRLNSLAATYAAKGVRIVGVISNRQDSAADIRAYLMEHSLSFPLVRDINNLVADAYEAKRTPEVYLLNSSLEILYRGRVDDQYEPGVSRNAPTRLDLQEALDEAIARKPVSVPQTEVSGCLIGRVRTMTLPPVVSEHSVTFCNQVIRVFEQHCIECHRSGEIGPFSLDNYEDAVGWAETSLEVIDNGRMPPWNADPEIGHFANARHMPERDRQVLRDWIAQGMPEGDQADMPQRQQRESGWQLDDKPDFEVAMRNRPYSVAAEGTIEYQYFVVDPGFEEDKWVTAAQIIPGNRSVVHHAIVFIRPPDGSEFRGIGWLTAYVPGQRLVDMPPGFARRIPAGSKLVFQMHYTANGSPQEDLTKLAIQFCDASRVTHQLITLIGIDQEFEIPPRAANHKVTGKVRWMPKQGQLIAVAPHMHVRGKSFVLTAERNGIREPLLSVPEYDFNWQHNYVLQPPLPIEDLDGIHFEATFDNSAQNPFNPDPDEWVNWGDQTWEEMAVVFLEVAEPIAPRASGSEEETRVTGTERKPSMPESSGNEPEQRHEERVRKFVDDFFARLDANNDGVVDRKEAPIALRNQFWRFDPDGDQRATREELRELADKKL
ncbi:MAG: redoxin domain-containing protein [Planctomycetaceae bacterium]|nr:redoxin domain-containing protein [Planctomycetaceae bacterium]